MWWSRACALPGGLPKSVSLVELLNLSLPQSSHLSKGNDGTINSITASEMGIMVALCERTVDRINDIHPLRTLRMILGKNKYSGNGTDCYYCHCHCSAAGNSQRRGRPGSPASSCPESYSDEGDRTMLGQITQPEHALPGCDTGVNRVINKNCSCELSIYCVPSHPL